MVQITLMLIRSSLSLAYIWHGTSITKIPMHQLPRMDALLDTMVTCRTSRLQQQPGYIHISVHHQTNKKKTKKKMLVIIKARAQMSIMITLYQNPS